MTSRTPRYCCHYHHRSASLFHSWNQAFRIIGFLGCSQSINPAWCWEQREGQLIWPYYIFLIIRHPGFMIITPSFSPFTIFSVIRGLTIASVPRMLDLQSSHQTVFVETVFKINIEFCCHLWCNCCIFLDTVLFNIRDPLHLVLVFSHCSSQLMMSSHHLYMLS